MHREVKYTISTTADYKLTERWQPYVIYCIKSRPKDWFDDAVITKIVYQEH